MNQGSTPNNTNPNGTPYQQPQQPGYQPPQQPAYQPPQQPAYQPPQPAYQRPAYQPAYQAPQQPADKYGYTGDPKFKPLSAWAYVGYLLLYSVVPFGWIAAIIHATKDDNINRRNFARGYWCMVLLSVIVSTVIVILSIAVGASIFTLLNNNFSDFTSSL